ncbi:glycosyltransferase family 2 protein [Desulfobacter postgatei]|uniref:glycosyltransferase family 2 protein n=1 Tax=Desulfobacter postgatei TaxID=2293 RepID=UPI00259B3779|nr:glycosyltransferase family 2 protein [uncultured Desulfobacter sp.]
MLMIEIIFWTTCFLIIYPFVIYPSLLKLLASKSKYPSLLQEFTDSWPKITFIISAYNEARVISEKLENALSITYPENKLEILVVSDASDDGTDEIVLEKSLLDNRIKLLRQDERKGKTAGLNKAMEHINSDIVIFSDANAMYTPQAFQELVKYFKNPQVGYVVGAAIYNENAKNLANKSEGTYWDSELAIKQLESDFYSVVGGDGAIYAIRRELFWPLEDDDINDLANPLQIIANGYRGIFNPNAICYEDSAENFEKEFRRKRRIVNRSFRAISKYIGLFKLKKHKKFLFMLVSHKILRWLVIFFVILFTLSALILAIAGKGIVYTLALYSILLSVVIALIGKKFSQNPSCPRILYLVYYCYLVGIAAMFGIFDNLQGRHHITWDHIRKSEN